MPVRIKGLVRAFNDVRAQLQTGIDASQEEQFRERVRAIVAQVEEICASSGVTPASLPPPSRRAYAFLKELDTTNLPKSDGPRSKTKVARLKIANVVKGADIFSSRIWHDLISLDESGARRDGVASEMLQLVASIEEICSRCEATPASLEEPSRRAYAWLKFLLDNDNLRIHFEALDRAKAALAGTAQGSGVELHLVSMNSVWRRRNRGKLTLLKVNEGFIYADDKVWQALINNIFSRKVKDNKSIVNEYLESEEFSGVLFVLEAFAERPATASGHAHSLDESFERVNADYFAGSMPKPTLHWNSVMTLRKFGHYDSARDIVMLSISLDDPSVPQSLVDYVMYHELLHKKHGVKLANGRRMAHTPAFRKDDQGFKGYEDAMAQLNKLASRL